MHTLADAAEIDEKIQLLPSRISQSSEQSDPHVINDDAASLTRENTKSQKAQRGKHDYYRKF